MDDSTKTDTGGNTSEDIEELLSLHVSKDYINCVWTKEPNSNMMDHENSLGNLVIADVTSEADAHNGTASDDTETTAPVLASKDPIKAVESSTPNTKKKRKKVSKAKRNKKPVLKSSMKAINKLTKSARRNVSVVKDRSCETANLPVASLSLTQQGATGRQIIASKSNKGFTIVSHQEKIDPKSQLKVNGFDDTLSTTDETLFAAYKNLIVQRSLPPYTPKELDSRFFSGNYFNCRACGDQYVLQTSFLGHMSRKTAKFSYKCPVCKVQLCFDNRCNFLLHITSHGMDTDDIKAGDLSVQPPSSEESECDAPFKNTSSNYTRCSECSKLFTSLQLHLQEPSAVNSTGGATLSCKECALLLPSKCALSAHERYHQGDPPYLCPECGQLFLKSTTLLKHMDEDCLHDAKRTVFQCGYCRVVVASLELFKEHLVTKHLRLIYKCPVCGISLDSFEVFDAHRVEQHSLLHVTAQSRAAVLRAQVECDKCPGMTINVDCLQDHAASHSSDPKFMTTVFQCKVCQCMFASKKLMLSHRVMCKGKRGIVTDTLADCSELFVDVAPFQSAVPNEDSHLEQASRLASDSASLSGSPVSSEQISDDKGQLEITTANDSTQVKGFIDEKCLDSNDTPGTVEVTVPGANKTGQIHLFKKNVVCKLCKKVVSVGIDKAVIKRHFSSYHFGIFMKAIYRGGSAQLPMQIVYTRSKDTMSRSDEEIVDKFIRTVCVKGDIPKIKSRVVEANWSKRKSSKASLSPFKIGAETKKRRLVKTDGLECYKCSFTSDNIKAFRAHILLHKSNATDLQCPECGLCFIVRPPLEKHLIAEHGIRNVDKYLVENGFEEHFSEEDEKQLPDIESGSEVLQENECKVCRKEFESALLLEKHFRVHGGAFLLANLKAKRAAP